MQILREPECPVRDLEWYKTRYEGLREDVLKQKEDFESILTENKALQKHITILEHQLDASKDMIDELWIVLGELSGKTRIEHDE